MEENLEASSCDIEEGLAVLITSLLATESYEIVDAILDKLDTEEMMLGYSLAVWRAVQNEENLKNRKKFLQKLKFRVESDNMKLEDYV